jgi:predicted small lipoprotein YifL
MFVAKIDEAPGLASARQSLYGAAAFGEIAVNRSASPSRWAILVVAIATLALAGCGRKGGLDLPPGAAAVKDTEAAQVEAPAPVRQDVFNSPSNVDVPPAAAKGRKKAFILDPLLD